MSKLSRRETLARGGQVVAAAAVLPFIPTVAHAKEDAELFALYERCRWLEKKYIAAINRYEEPYFAVRRQFPRYLDGVKPEGLAEAEERAGVPALEEKKDAAERAYLDTLDRFFDTRANTPQGMIIKITIEWSDRTWRKWRAKGATERLHYPPDAIPSILVDLERLAGRAI